MALRGRVGLSYIWTQIAEKLYRFSQRRKYVSVILFYFRSPQVAMS